MSLAYIEKKTASDSVAQALARKVLPVPGGPYKSIPLQGYLIPTNTEGNFIGTITANLSYSFAVSKPAISLHFILGFSYNMTSPLSSLASLFSSDLSLGFYFF